MAIRILLLTQWFDPEPTFKGMVFARQLIQQGFDVEVLTGFPNYPGGKIYAGYKLKLIQREFIDGVNITRVPLYPSHDHGAIGRIFNYISFAAAALFYGLFGAKRPDVIYAYHPPLTVGITAALIKFFRRVPIVYDIQDMWPDTLRATGMLSNDKALKVVSWVCDWVYRRFDQLVVLSPGFKRLLVERGVPESKIEIIYNWCAEDMLFSTSIKSPINFPASNKFRVLFAGNMGKAQALPAVIEAAKLVQEQTANVVFVFLGGGLEVDSLKKLASDKSLSNVIFLPPVTMTDVGLYLAEADVLLVHLKDDPLFSITIPSKTQAYMAAGKPIIMAVNGDAAELIKNSHCGYAVEAENPSSIAQAVLNLLQASTVERRLMAENGKHFYYEQLSVNVGSKKFGEIFTQLANSNTNRQKRW